MTQQSAQLLFSDGIYHKVTTSRGRDQLPAFLSRITKLSGAGAGAGDATRTQGVLHSEAVGMTRAGPGGSDAV